MKTVMQWAVAAILVVGGGAMAQTSATQTVTTNVAGAVSISLTDGTSTDQSSLSTTLTSTAAGGTASHPVTLNVNSSDTTGFNVTAAADNNGYSQGHMCEWDPNLTTPGYTSNCLVNAMSVAATSSIATQTGDTGAATVTLGTSPGKIFGSSNTVSSGTITSTVNQTIDWTDKVLTNTDSYKIIVTYTIASGA